MSKTRSVLAGVLATSALLLVPIGLQAKPRAVQQPRNGQRVVKNIVLQLQLAKARQHRKAHTITGTVLSVHQNKQVPGTGSIKLQVNHHPRKHNNQVVAVKANGNAGQVVAVKKAKCKRAAAAIGQQKRRHGNTVTIHYGQGTKVAVTVKGLFDHLVTKTVGSGKNKAKVVLNQPKVQTKNLPSHVRHVQKGQTLRVTLHEPHQQHRAKQVHILTPSVTGKAQ